MRKITTATIAVLLTGTLLSFAAGLRAQAPEFRPPRTAFLDIHRVIEKYERSRAVEKNLAEKADRLRTSFDERMLEIRKKEQLLDGLSESSSEFRKQKRAIDREKFDLQYELKEQEQVIRKEARDEMANIYREIQNAVERYATAVDLDAVLLVSRGELPGDTLPEVKFQIAVRPVLYIKDDLDVTDPILSILNAK